MNKKYTPEKYFAAFLLASAVFHLIFPGKILITSPYNFAGLLFILSGAGINLWAGIHFSKRKTAVKHGEKVSSLLRSGPFSFTRNPMYLGMTMILLGVAVFLGSLISFAFPIIFIIVMEAKFIYEEEKHLEKAFGQKYREYTKRTRKWI